MTNKSPGPAPPAADLLVVRHGESEWNALGRWQGQADPELSTLGEQQAALAATSLAGAHVDRVVSSDLRRARRTAVIITELLGIGPPTLDPGLREVDVGEWSGLTRREIETRWPSLVVAWSEGRLEATPGGETLSALRSRVTQAIRRLLEDGALANGSDPSTILVVSHRRAITALEESVGVRPIRAGHLAGRRFATGPSGDLLAGEPLYLLDDQSQTGH